MIAVLIMTDGRRECFTQTLASAQASLRGPISEWWVHDDSGDPEYGLWLDRVLFDECRLHRTGQRSGFGGAIRSAWSQLRQRSSARFVFHLEDDFTFNQPVDLAPMVDVLNGFPHIVQLALRRQPWNDAERAAGGIVEQHPGDYSDERGWTRDGWLDWLEHRRFFTTNPSLYRRSLIDGYDWPEGVHSEGRFGIDLLQRNPDWRFAYWGARGSGEAVTHIGHERVGTGY